MDRHGRLLALRSGGKGVLGTRFSSLRRESASKSGQERLITVSLMNSRDGNYNTRSPRRSPLRFEEHIRLWTLRYRVAIRLAWSPLGDINPGSLTASWCSYSSVPSLSCGEGCRTTLGLPMSCDRSWLGASQHRVTEALGPRRARKLCSPVVLDVVLYFAEAHGVAQGQVVGAGLHRGAPVHLWGGGVWSTRLEIMAGSQTCRGEGRRPCLGAEHPHGSRATWQAVSLFICS